MKQTVLLAASGWRRDLYVSQLEDNPVDEFLVFTADSLDGLFHLRKALDLTQTLPSNGVAPVIVVMQDAERIAGNILRFEERMGFPDLTVDQIYREFHTDVESGAIDALFYGVRESDYIWSSIQWARRNDQFCQRPSPDRRLLVAV